MNRLSDFFLQSGFESQYGIYELDMERARASSTWTSCARRFCALLQEGELIPPELMEKLLQNPDLSQNEELRDMIDQIIQRMEEEGYITQQQSARVTPPPVGDTRRADRPRPAATWKRDSKSRTRRSIFSDSRR